jgi:hypothetical protein
MTYDDETLGRYIDGELNARDVAALDAAIARDGALAARVSEMRAVSLELRGDFADILSEDVPERLRAAVMTGQSDLAARPVARRSFLSGWRLPAFASGAAGAAGLALGLAIAPASVLALDDGGHLVAKGQLAQALNQGLASEPGEGAVIGVSFRATDGAWCRSFETGAREAGVAGLACASNGSWRVETAAATAPRAGAYAQASAAMPDAVRAAIAARIAGEPLDAAAERAARDTGWK